MSVLLPFSILGAPGDDALDVADVFSTDLYTGNGSTQSITNGVDLSGEGGLVWRKARAGTYSTDDHILNDTSTGISNCLRSNSTGGLLTSASRALTSVSSSGFTIPSDGYPMNWSGTTYAAWTFRRAPKFFDVVTYTGDGVAGREIAHNLGQVPGMIVIKKTNAGGDNWAVWHRGVSTQGGRLNLAGAFEGAYYTEYFEATQPTASVFTIGDNGEVNANTATYVAYLFAHDTSDSGIIQCGSYTGNGSASGPTITLGWEPQWLLVKNATANGAWNIMDNVRGVSSTTDKVIWANDSALEQTRDWIDFNSTGFEITGAEANYSNINDSGETYIYMAIKAEGA